MMIRIIWRNWRCWRAVYIDWPPRNDIGYIGALSLGLVCIDVFRS